MENNRSEKLGTMPIPKLLWMMSAPAILSMFVQSLYNVVDSIFVAKISETALTAVTLAFPMQMLVLAFSLGIGIGTNSIISRRLGEKNFEEASKIAKNGLFMAVCTGLFFLVFGYFIATLFADIFTEKGTLLYNYTKDYLVICVAMSFGMFIEICITKIMQATGNMIIPMVTQLIGAITNIVLDYIFIFGKLGFPAMGVAGAALATVIGQIVAMIFAIYKFSKMKLDFSLALKGFRPNKCTLIEITKIGTPVAVMNSVGSVAIGALNGILIVISKTAVAVLGVYFKLQSFIFMPVFGLNQGSMPILGYNYGANNKSRFRQTILVCFCSALTILSIGLLLFQILPKQMLELFSASDEMIDVGVNALRFISLSFIPAAMGIVMINMFQSIGHGFKSMAMSLLRQIIFLLPIAFLLSKVTILKYVWLAFPIAEILTVIIFFPIAVQTIKTAFRKRAQFSGIANDPNGLIDNFVADSLENNTTINNTLDKSDK
ncbi:MAG: MATE family efflux transporter [Clostridia bacterium]